MGFKTTSFISIANRGLNPTISSSLTRRVVNPVWSFNRTVVVTFTSSGSWVCPANVTSVEYLVVGLVVLEQALVMQLLLVTHTQSQLAQVVLGEVVHHHQIKVEMEQIQFLTP